LSGARVTFENTRFVYPEGIWSLAVPSLRLGGERVVCIVGPNGSGKSTLLRLAAGILSPSAGCIRLDDRPLAAMPRRVIARRIAFLPQEDPPLFDYTVEAVVRMGRYAHVGWTGALTPTDAMAVREALTAVDLAALRNRPLSRLSGGERRRTMIASVLAQQPRLLLLDEPTSSLDIHHAVAVMRLLADFGPHGPAVALVTHDINLAALFGDRLLLMRNGGIYADGTPREVVRADIMRQVYGEDLLVREHPETGGPMIVPRRTAVASGSDAHV
jgi:iron complex transport system ATP-binding protein